MSRRLRPDWSPVPIPFRYSFLSVTLKPRVDPDPSLWIPNLMSTPPAASRFPASLPARKRGLISRLSAQGATQVLGPWLSSVGDPLHGAF